MLLAIDIGNTNITFGLFKGGKLTAKFSITTKDVDLTRLTKKLKPGDFDSVIVCSVVPQASSLLESFLNDKLGRRPFFIGRDIKIPMENRYRRPKQVGSDRLVNAFAGIFLYGAPLIVVDFGTAVTFDVVSENKEYLGGMILPGLSLSLSALGQNTALLPKIKLSTPAEFIARDTKSSMLSGIVHGFAAITDDFARKIKEKIGRKAKVIITGGDARLMGRYCRQTYILDEDLTLKGLNLLGSTIK